jgi:uncharacterized protein
MRFFIGFFVILVLTSCAEKVRTYHDNGSLNEVYSIDDEGEKNGEYKRFSSKDILLETSNFIHGLQNGERKLYYDSGKLEEIQRFEIGKLNGPQIGFHENGKTKFTCTNKENLLQGEYHSYFDNGKKRLFLTFVDDLENGPFIEYYRSGGMEWKGNYRNGNKEFGLLEQFDEKGELIKKMQCDTLGACFTIWKK